MSYIRFLLTAVTALTLIACEQTPDTVTQDGIDEAGFIAIYNPTEGKLPFPTNLLFNGTDLTYTLNIPAATDDSAGTTAVKAALNQLDGFSTVSPVSMDFSSAIDTSTLIGGSTVRVFEVATLTPAIAGAVTGITSELTVDVDYVLSVSSVDNEDGTEKGANKLVVSPIKPLKANTSYMVVVTKGVASTTGKVAASDVTYAFTKSASELHTLGTSKFTALSDAQAVQLEDLRLLNNTSEAVVSGWATAMTATPLNAADIAVSWSFTTQSVGDVLTALHSKIQTDPAPVSSIFTTAVAVSPQDGVTGFVGSDIYVGQITLPYYLNVPADAHDNSPLEGSWRGAGDSALTQYNPTLDPTTATNVTVPLLVSIPNGPKPGAGWPVVIFQHGITSNRGSMMGLVDVMANAGASGFAVVAIDMPFHGLLGTEDLIGGFRQATIDFSAAINGGTATVQERIFDLDLFDAAIGTNDADGDGVTDDSGTHFINLPSLLTSRDNVRQSVADLFSLKRAISIMDYDGGGADFNAANIHFVGHSLGGIVGGVFLAIETSVQSSVLGMSGGGIAKLLDGSASFGPVIAAGLSANGVTKGTAEYESFLASAQMVLDSADPVNYASSTVAGRNVLLFEVIGDGVDNLPDQVIPNNVIDITGTVNAPLSGTDPLVNLMSLTQIDTSNTFVANTDTVVKFIGGNHSSLLTPALADGTENTDPATIEYKVYAEMQTEMGSFIASDGNLLSHTGLAADVIATVPVP